MAGRKANSPVNSDKKAEDEAKSLLFYHMQKRRSHNEAIEEIQRERKKDALKARIHGLAVDELDFAIKEYETADTALPRAKYIKRGQILVRLGLITEFDPETLLADREPADERRQRQGEIAGGLGVERDSPFAPDSEDTQNWLIGYDRGRRIFLDNIADAMENADKAAVKSGDATKKKATKGGEPLDGDLPPEAQAKAPDKPALEAPKKPKGKKPAKPGDENDGKTNAEIEAERQSGAAFN